jgi:hypothetical protein
MFQKDHSAFIFRVKLFILILLDPDSKNTVIILSDGNYLPTEKV